jgi:hypothetical protein
MSPGIPWWRLTAHKISEVFGQRLHRKISGKLATVIEQIEHDHHVYRAYFKNAFRVRRVRKQATSQRAAEAWYPFGEGRGLSARAGWP